MKPHYMLKITFTSYFQNKHIFTNNVTDFDLLSKCVRYSIKHTILQ